MRLMWASDAIWANRGYCGQGRMLIPRFKAAGHKMAHFPWDGFSGARVTMGDVPVFPPFFDKWGSDCLGAHNQQFQSDLQISFQDLWCLPLDYRELIRTPFACYFPIDHEPISPLIRERVGMVDYPIVYSQFAVQQMKEAGLKHHYIPHGIDVSVYTPGDKKQARQNRKLPESAFIVTMVAANIPGAPPRKAWAENLWAFAEFRRKHKDVYLYLHTNEWGGVNFDYLLEALRIPRRSVGMVDQHALLCGVSDVGMADIYRASDVLLGASMAEGFGLPLAEAQACGTPVITTRHSAMIENTINGIDTEPLRQPYWNTLIQSWHAIPNRENILLALEALYCAPGDVRQKSAQMGIDHFRAKHDIEMVVRDYWLPFLAEVEQDAPRNKMATPRATKVAL